MTQATALAKEGAHLIELVGVRRAGLLALPPNTTLNAPCLSACLYARSTRGLTSFYTRLLTL